MKVVDPTAQDEPITAWVTKHALTSGIAEVQAVVCRGVSNDMISWRGSEKSLQSYAHGTEWHRTRAAAVEHANNMRRRRIESLRKQIARLEAMKF